MGIRKGRAVATPDQAWGFWIYNLDSKALGLVVNNLYRVDVYVGLVKATVANWAVLQPVK